MYSYFIRKEWNLGLFIQFNMGWEIPFHSILEDLPLPLVEPCFTSSPPDPVEREALLCKLDSFVQSAAVKLTFLFSSPLAGKEFA